MSSRGRAVFQCICGQILYAARLENLLAVEVRHGENPEHTRVFHDKVFRYDPDAVADWYREIHEREGWYGIREETSDNSDL